MASRIAMLAFGALASVGLCGPSVAQSRSHRATAGAGIAYAPASQHGGHGAGTRALVSDGPGTGFGFYHMPAPIRFAAAVHRDRQSAAVRSAVITDALTNGGPYGFGYRDSVYGYGNRATYGVFSGADGYGSPYFAGYYGPGGGADLGVLGHAYE